jgi:hypothetical protein
VGLVKHLLFWPVTVPKALVEFSMRQVEGFARTELTDDAPIREDLMLLQMELELGSISEEDYVAREAVIIQRLRDARAWRERFGMEEPWAPLGAPADDPREESPEAPDPRE